MTTRFIGTEKLTASLKRVALEVPQELAREMFREAETIMLMSKRDFVPVDLGVLRNSGLVEQPRISTGGRITVRLGFGGPAVGYAVVQHENLEFEHTVGQAKYLEIPATKQAENMPARIAARLRSRIPV